MCELLFLGSWQNELWLGCTSSEKNMKDEICINTFVATSTDAAQVPGGNGAVNNGQVHLRS